MWEKYAKDINQLVSGFAEEKPDAIVPTKEQFARLLTEPFASKRIPGFPYRMNENENYHLSDKDAEETRAFLKQMFRIVSKETLIEFQREQFINSVHYEQFMTFWKDAPLFDVNELNPQARKGFEECMSNAKAFYPYIQERGLYAFDICEYIGLCRTANSCGIITDQDFDEITDRFVRKAQVFYHSFKEYALSYIYGGMYFMKSPDYKQFEQFIDIQKRIVSNLFEPSGPWERYTWYKPKSTEWVQIYPGNPGCIISKMALEGDIGYMYRDEGSPGNPDSGWRFLRGDEPDEYANNPDNLTIVSLNTICNLRPDILAYLEAPIGSAYGWNGNDWVKEPLIKN